NVTGVQTCALPISRPPATRGPRDRTATPPTVVPPRPVSGDAGPTEWGAGTVGVGPWEVEHPGTPRPTGEHWDPELLDDGDRRNVVDRYRYWRREAIVADLDPHRHTFHVAIENFGHDSNIGTV